ncbi:MAG: hypothetical protein WCH39_05870 [Schlesneria sp.]
MMNPKATTIDEADTHKPVACVAGQLTEKRNEIMTETKTTTFDNIDIINLVDDGHLELDDVFDGARWSNVEELDTYTAMCGGSGGDSPMTITIMLESAEIYGITAYRWIECDDAGSYDTGEITLDRAEAVEQGKAEAEERDETPEPDEQVAAILATEWFKTSVKKEDLRAIIDYCHQHAGMGQGHVIIDRSGVHEWVTTGYVEHKAVYVGIPHEPESWAYFADAMLSAITENQQPSEE